MENLHLNNRIANAAKRVAFLQLLSRAVSKYRSWADVARGNRRLQRGERTTIRALPVPEVVQLAVVEETPEPVVEPVMDSDRVFAQSLAEQIFVNVLIKATRKLERNRRKREQKKFKRTVSCVIRITTPAHPVEDFDFVYVKDEVPKQQYAGPVRPSHKVRRAMRAQRRAQRKKKTVAPEKKVPVTTAHKQKPHKPRPHKWTTMERKVNAPVSLFGVGLQSGKVLPSPMSAKPTRAQRDEIQRQAAQERATAARKAVPKEQRQQDVLAARDKRNPAVQLQSGKFVGAAIGAALTLLFSQTTKLLKKSNKAMDSINHLIDKMSEVKQVLLKALGPILWTAPLALTIYFALGHFTHIPGPLLSLAVTALSVVVGPKIWKIIAKFFPDSNDLSGDSVKLQSGILDNAPRILSTIFTFSVFRGRASASTVTEFCKRISMLERMTSGWEVFMRWMLEAMQSGVNFIRHRFGKERVDFFQSAHKPTYEWATRVDEAARQHNTAQVDLNADELNKLVGLVNEGYCLKEAYRGTSMMGMISAYVAKATDLLHPHLGSLNARNNFRLEPVAVMLLGAPGIGKTLMASHFCTTVLIQSGLMPPGTPMSRLQENIWQKGPTEYWNGYSRQEIIVIDDAFQQRADAKDKDSDYINVIRMISPWCFPLNFADLASKGKIYFGSKMVLGTTNLGSIDSEARTVLHEPEAVVRRFKFPYEIRLKQQYAIPGTNKLDYSAYTRELDRCLALNEGIHRYPWHIWEAVKHDFIADKPLGDPIPMSQLVEDVAQELRQRISAHELAMKVHDEYAKGLPGVQLQAGKWLSTRPTLDNSSASSECGELPPALDLKAFHKELNSNLEELKSGARGASRILTLLTFAVGGIIAFGFVRGILGGLWSVLTSLFKRGKGKPRIQSNRPLTSAAKRMHARDIRTQGCDQSVATNAYANSYKLSALLDDGAEFILGQVLFIEHELAALPEHFTAQLKLKLAEGELKLNSKLKFRHSLNEAHTFEMSLKKFLSFSRISKPNIDVEFVKFEDVRAHRNISSNFIKEGDIRYLGGVRARLDVCGVDERKRVCNANTRTIFVIPSLSYGQNLTFVPRKLQRYFSYQAHTVAGDCGAPLCIFDSSSYSGRTVIGVHVCGAEERRVGYSNIITQEMIDEARSELQVIRDNFVQDLAERGVSLQAGNLLPFENGGSFLPIGEVERPVVICPKTSYYVVDDLFGSLGEYTCKPAPLAPVYRNGVLVYPMENAVKPYSSPLLIYEQEWLKQATHIAMQPLTRVTKDSPRIIYTFEEAVCGIPQEKFRSIPRGTAAGFPYVYDVRNGKKEIFGDGENYDLTTPLALELRKRVEHVISSARSGIRLSHVFVDFLKDELRSEQKVQDVATRLISSAPLDYVVAFRMFFGAFCTAVMKNHTLTGMAPGICTYTDWNVLAWHLSKHGPKVFDGDFKAFDSSEQPCVHSLLLDYINRWYADGEENALVRRVLWLDLVHSRHIGGMGKDQRYIYQWNKSLPSGHPFTTVVNSMYSLFLLSAAYIVATGDRTGFWGNVSAITYGDDNASNVSEAVADRYNQVTVAKVLKDEFQVVYTPGRKDGVWKPTMELTELGFLKRGFREEDDYWLCPLELDSFLYTCYWCKNKKLEAQITLDVLENSLEELSMHPQELWDQYAPHIYQLLQERGHVPRAPLDRGQYLAIIKGRSDSWY